MDIAASGLVQDLTESDRRDLGTFLENETSKAKIQSSVHHLTEICFKKCITSKISTGAVDRSEESCMQNCVDRYIDSQILIVNHLEQMRQKLR